MARFVAGVRGGALVVEAARAAKVTVATLYRRRKACAGFAAAWDEAAAGSGAAVLRRTGKTRRMRFDAGRRGHFLIALEATCNIDWAAETAGVHKSIVYRRIARDGGFARACAGALARGYPALEAELAREDAAKAARVHAPIVATGRFTGDFELAMKLMARWERPAAHGKSARAWRRRRAPPPLAESLAAIEKKLAAIGIPVRGAEDAGPEEGRDKGAASG
jgi:hypothetical protein